jgi:uncharacterized membrane protein
MIEIKQSRWRSPVLWISTASLIGSLLVTLGVIPVDTSTKIDEVVGIVVTILAGFGIINSPTNKNSL